MDNTKQSNNRFRLMRLENNRYIVTDTETDYSIIFKAGAFKISQKVIAPDTQTENSVETAKQAAYAMRCIGDYMAQNHPDLVFPSEEQERRRQHYFDCCTDVGRSLRQLREYRGRTLDEVAELSGFSTRRLDAIEAGKLPGDLNALTRIIERLGGRLAIVVEDTPNDPHCQFIEFE